MAALGCFLNNKQTTFVFVAYVCVCMCMYMFVRMCLHDCACVYMCLHVCMSEFVYMCGSLCVCVCMCIYVHMNSAHMEVTDTTSRSWFFPFTMWVLGIKHRYSVCQQASSSPEPSSSSAELPHQPH